MLHFGLEQADDVGRSGLGKGHRANWFLESIPCFHNTACTKLHTTCAATWFCYQIKADTLLVHMENQISAEYKPRGVEAHPAGTYLLLQR